MTDVPIQLIVAAFNDEKAANEALKTLKQAKREKLIAIKDAAVIRRDEKNKVHIKDIRDVGGGKGALAGGIFGAAIALIGGPAGIILAGATGALVGGLAAKKIDMGLPNDRLKELSESLKPGTSAIVAIIEHTWVAEIERELAEAGAQVMTEALKQDIAEQLESGREVAYSALSTDDALAIDRIAGDEDQLELSSIVTTDEGVSAQATVVTKEGAATKKISVTDEGIAAGEAVITEEGVVAAGYIATDEGVTSAALVADTEQDDSDESEEGASGEG